MNSTAKYTPIRLSSCKAFDTLLKQMLQMLLCTVGDVFTIVNISVVRLITVGLHVLGRVVSFVDEVDDVVDHSSGLSSDQVTAFNNARRASLRERKFGISVQHYRATCRYRNICTTPVTSRMDCGKNRLLLIC